MPPTGRPRSDVPTIRRIDFTIVFFISASSHLVFTAHTVAPMSMKLRENCIFARNDQVECTIPTESCAIGFTTTSMYGLPLLFNLPSTMLRRKAIKRG